MSGRNRVEPGAIFDAVHEDEAAGLRHITEAALRPIAEKYDIDIPELKVEEVCRRLSAGASAYLFARSVEGSVKQQRLYQDAQRKIRRVGRRIEELKSALESLLDSKDAAALAAASLFDDVEDIVRMKMLSEEPKISSFGHPFYRIGEGKTFWNRDQIFFYHIDVLGNMTQHILTKMRSINKGGRPPNEAMPIWVNNAYFIWTKTLGNPFTFAQHQGVPITDAGHFCWQTLLMIDPCPNWSEFSTAMGQAVRRGRPGRGRRRVVEKSQKPAPRTAEDIASTSC